MLKDKIKMTGQEISILDNENKLQYLIDLAKDVDVLDQKFKTDDKKYLNDAMMTSIAGISAAMKNTG